MNIISSEFRPATARLLNRVTGQSSKIPDGIKRLFQVIPITLALISSPLAGLALDVKDVPNPRKINNTWVTDMAGILDEPTENQLNSMIAQLEQKNGTEIAVVTVYKTFPAASPKAFTTELFNYWGIGKKEQNNGILFLVSTGDRRVEIETGYGINKILPNAQVGNIINTQVTPRFKESDFNGGTLAGTKALIVALDKPQKTISTAQIVSPTQSSTIRQEATQDNEFPWGLLLGGGVILGGGFILAIAVNNSVKRRKYQNTTKPFSYTSKASSNYHYAPSSNKAYHPSSDIDIDLDIDTSDEDDSNYREWMSAFEEPESNSNSFGSGSSFGDGAGSNYDSNWNSDNSNSSSYESSDSSWSSDSSSSSSYDSSDFGGGSSGSDGAGSDW
jgi:uncharacterized membrane protein YgcG